MPEVSVAAALNHFSLITIDVGNLWEVLTGVLQVKPSAGVGVQEYTDRLSKLVQSPGPNSTLYVSVGTADFVTPWLTRLYAEPAVGLQTSAPRLDALVLKHIDLNAAEALEAAGALEPRFVERLRLNMEDLQREGSDLTKRAVRFKTCLWKLLPFFHGYLFEDTFLIGPWRVGHGGHLHVRTPLVQGSAKELPNVYQYLRTAFSQLAT